MIIKGIFIILLLIGAFTIGANSVVLPDVVNQESMITYNYNQPATKNGAQVNGYYDPTSGILTVFTQNRTREQVEHTMLHEFGHYVDHLNKLGLDGNEIFAENYAVNHKIVEVE